MTMNDQEWSSQSERLAAFFMALTAVDEGRQGRFVPYWGFSDEGGISNKVLSRPPEEELAYGEHPTDFEWDGNCPAACAAFMALLSLRGWWAEEQGFGDWYDEEESRSDINAITASMLRDVGGVIEELQDMQKRLAKLAGPKRLPGQQRIVDLLDPDPLEILSQALSEETAA